MAISVFLKTNYKETEPGHNLVHYLENTNSLTY